MTKILIGLLILSALVSPYQSFADAEVPTEVLVNLDALDTTTVIEVIDGDTLKIKYKSKQEIVWLIGIDAPESSANSKAYKDAYKSKKDIKTITGLGKQAVAFVKTLVNKGNIVKIEFDIQKRDKYKRLLGYVYLASGVMLNEEIIKAGYAAIMACLKSS